VVAALVDTPLDRDEFLRRIRAPLSPQELADATELIRWFTRRYPTPEARFAYARVKYRQMTRR